MSNEYLDSLNRLARKRQLALTKEQEKAIYRVYSKATEDYYEKFLNGMGNNKAINALHMEYAREMASKLETIITEYSIEACANTIGIMRDIMDKSYDQYGLRDSPYAKSVHQIANTLIDNSARRILLGDIYKDGKGLSERIWNATNRSGEAINEVIAQCLAQQLSAVETSKVLKSFMKPGVSTTWDRAKIKEKLGPGYAAWNKDISYEALRLARTTINHSATLGMKEAGKLNPYLKSVMWHSVHAIGRTCEQCKERNGSIYTLAQLPFDHPNGLCWNEPILDKSLDEIADELKNWVEGGKNSRLDEYWQVHGKKYAPLPSKQPPKPKRSEEWVDKNFRNLRYEVGREHWPEIRQALLNAPDFMQDFFKSYQHRLDMAGKDPDGGAYYHPRWKHIIMDLDHDRTNKKGRYSTFYHEYGHFIDDMLRYNVVKLKGDYPSKDPRLIAAIKEDYQDLLRKAEQNIIAKGWNVKPMYIRDEMRAMQKQAGRDLSAGPQDVIGALSDNKYNLAWGHSNEYWNRRNKDHEIASEGWANITAAYMDPIVGESYRSLMPKSMDVFETIVKEIFK